MSHSARETLSHGSHPGHAFGRALYLSSSQQCCICRAAACHTDASWFRCCKEGCNYVLCSKCFEIDEVLFPTPQVVIRNPLAPYDDAEVAVYTRPRPSSYRLYPLYAGRLVRVVSRSLCTEDERLTFFRLDTGGWVNAAHLVSVVPAANSIERLAKIHLQGAQRLQEGGSLSADEMMPGDALVRYMQESTQLIVNNPLYGIVMASLTLYPVLLFTEKPGEPSVAMDIDEEQEPRQTPPPSCAERGYGGHAHTPFAEVPSLERASHPETISEVISFLHFVIHFALGEIECWLEDRGTWSENVVLSLYLDVLAKSLLAMQDIREHWEGQLLDEMGSLVLRSIFVFGKVHALLYHESPSPKPLQLRAPAVVDAPASTGSEKSRLRHLGSTACTIGRHLIQHYMPHFQYDLSDLRPLHMLLAAPFTEVLERTMCELLVTAVERRPATQRRLFEVDPLEIVVRLITASLAPEGLVSACRLVCVAARRCARNIAMMTSIVLPPLLQVAKVPHTPAVMQSVIDCFYELAFNDPRTGVSPASSQSVSPLSESAFPSYTVGRWPSTPGHLCTQVVHPNCAPFQLMQRFAVPSGHLVGLCSGCSYLHPPSQSSRVGEAEFAHFKCQCIVCAKDVCGHPLPPPVIPLTSAISMLAAGGLDKLLLHYVQWRLSDANVLNAVGRLVLRVQVSDDVIIALLEALVKVVRMGKYADSALAVAAYAHRPRVAGLVRKHASTPIGQYITEPYESVDHGKTWPDQTPGSSQTKSDLGLSPSPIFDPACNDALGERVLGSTRRHMRLAVDLFATPATGATLFQTSDCIGS